MRLYRKNRYVSDQLHATEPASGGRKTGLRGCLHSASVGVAHQCVCTEKNTVATSLKTHFHCHGVLFLLLLWGMVVCCRSRRRMARFCTSGSKARKQVLHFSHPLALSTFCLLLQCRKNSMSPVNVHPGALQVQIRNLPGDCGPLQQAVHFLWFFPT